MGPRCNRCLFFELDGEVSSGGRPGLLSCCSGPRSAPLTLFRPDLPVSAPEIQQRISRPHYHVFDFRNKDRMVSRVLRGVQAALEIGQGAMQDRGAMLRAIKASSGLLLSVLVGRRWQGVVF